jgi:serine/threonine protein kinase/Tfp pilus assembly protein PilF
MSPELTTSSPARGFVAVDSTETFVADSERERLARILDEYLQGVERGEPLPPEELFARHPDVADRLRGYLSGLALFHRAAAGQPVPLPSPFERGLESGVLLGDFRLVREIGRGGMGVVYEAVQLSLGRRAAVKVLPLAASVDEKHLARFQHEAQAAAQIDHPHIVPVFAIGQERGIHYFAMQLIVGQSLAEMIAAMRDEAGVGGQHPAAESLEHVQAVARMGVQAAEALNAAHEIGVVHRDVKPSNLLLDEKGKVWITDFGVARCKSSSSLTETGYVVGSIPYMSPEQALGQPALVDQRTDIYSLGVTLYELATLRHPGEGSAHAETAIEYHRSQWRRPRCWNSAIPVDFENIILKAMAEAREDRYNTAQELADDLRRFLEGKPILARPPTLSSRIEKWARRHQRALAATVGVLAVALCGLVASLFLIANERAEKDKAYRLAMENRQRAEENFRRAEAKYRQARDVLKTFSSHVNELLANELPGAEDMRRKLLAEMLPYYREFAREASHDPALQKDLALTYTKIGFLSDQLGVQSDAEHAYQAAQRILEKLIRTNPGNHEHRRNLALCCNNLAQILQKRGAMTAAQEELERALKIQRELAPDATADDSLRAELATTHSNLGLLFSQMGNKRQAARELYNAIQIQESIRKQNERDEQNLHSLAATYNNLSALYLPAQPAVARRWVERALALQLALVKEHPTRRDYQCDLALSYNNLGAIQNRLQDWSAAELCFRDAITIQERLVQVAPLVMSYQRDLAASFNNLGMSQTSAQNLAAAEESFQRALAIQQELVEGQPGDLTLLSALAGIENNLGIVQQQKGDWEAASATFQRAIDAQKQALAGAPSVLRFRESLSKHYFNLATVLRELDRPEEAAAATIARRELWPNDRARLLQIAAELDAIVQEIPTNETRQQVQQEARLTRKIAAELRMPTAGVRTGTFDVKLDEFPQQAAETVAGGTP